MFVFRAKEQSKSRCVSHLAVVIFVVSEIGIMYFPLKTQTPNLSFWCNLEIERLTVVRNTHKACRYLWLTNWAAIVINVNESSSGSAARRKFIPSSFEKATSLHQLVDRSGAKWDEASRYSKQKRGFYSSSSPLSSSSSSSWDGISETGNMKFLQRWLYHKQAESFLCDFARGKLT